MDNMTDFLEDMAEGNLGANRAGFDLWKLKNPDGDWQTYVNELAFAWKARQREKLDKIYW